jgi:cytochrome c biogenesis protein CcdA
MPLQKYGSIAIGPLLIIVGMFTLDLIPIGIPSANLAQTAASRVGGRSPWAAPLLGFLLAFSFCPLSAALFFGSLIPLAVSSQSPLLLPAVFGTGSALPVIALSLALWAGREALSRRFSRMSKAGSIAKKATGMVFIAAGIYYCLKYIFHLVP